MHTDEPTYRTFLFGREVAHLHGVENPWNSTVIFEKWARAYRVDGTPVIAPLYAFRVQKADGTRCAWTRRPPVQWLTPLPC